MEGHLNSFPLKFSPRAQNSMRQSLRVLVTSLLLSPCYREWKGDWENKNVTLSLCGMKPELSSTPSCSGSQWIQLCELMRTHLSCNCGNTPVRNHLCGKDLSWISVSEAFPSTMEEPTWCWAWSVVEGTWSRLLTCQQRRKQRMHSRTKDEYYLQNHSLTTGFCWPTSTS